MKTLLPLSYWFRVSKKLAISARHQRRLLALAFFSLAPVADAGTWDWDALSGNWNGAGNWVSATNPGTAPPTNTASSIISLSNGTALDRATTTLSADWVGAASSSFTIGSYNTLSLSAVLNFYNVPNTTSLTNNGVIQNSGNGAIRGSNFVKTNSGVIAAVTGGTFRFWDVGLLTNTDGLIVARSGGVFKSDGNLRVSGGDLAMEAGGRFFQDGVNPNQAINIDGVAVSNAGFFANVQDSSHVSAGLALLVVHLNESTVFTNEAGGVTEVLNAGSAATTNSVARRSLFSVNANASFINRGSVVIQNDATRTGSLSSQSAEMTVHANALGFKNEGTLAVIANTTAKEATASFSTARAFLNEGVVHVRGNADHDFASFNVTGASNGYTQTGSGTERTVLERGGVLSTAGGVVINDGSLGGVGEVVGVTTIGSNALLFAGETLSGEAGAGVLSFSHDLTLASGAEVSFGLGANTAASARVLLGGDLIFNSDFTLTLSALSGAHLTNGGTYRLFELTSGEVVGDLANITLVLPTLWTGVLQTGPDGAGYLDVTLEAIPEPTTAVLWVAGVGFSLLLARRRRRA